MKRCFFAVALGLALAAPAPADTLKYKDGRTLEVDEVTDETYEAVSYKIAGSPQQEPAAEIAEVIRARKPAAFAEAEKRFARREFAAAAQDFEKELNSREAWVRQYSAFLLAECRRELGDAEKAIQAYEKLLAEFPKSRFYPAAKLGTGLCRLARKDLAGARKAFEELTQEARTKKLGAEWVEEASFKLAEVLEAEGKLAEAMKAYSRIYSESAARGTSSGAGALAGVAAERLKAAIDASKADSALSALERLLAAQDTSKKGPETRVLAAIYNAIGEVNALRGDHKGALLAFLRVVVDPDLSNEATERPRALYGAALALEKLKSKDWKERAEALRRELKDLYPASPWAQK